MPSVVLQRLSGKSFLQFGIPFQTIRTICKLPLQTVSEYSRAIFPRNRAALFLIKASPHLASVRKKHPTYNSKLVFNVCLLKVSFGKSSAVVGRRPNEVISPRYSISLARNQIYPNPPNEPPLHLPDISFALRNISEQKRTEFEDSEQPGADEYLRCVADTK